MPLAVGYWFRIGPSLVAAPQISSLATYDPYSGETHFLSDLPLFILDVMTEQPSTIEQIGFRLTGEVLESPEQQQIGAALEALRQAEIVDFVPCRKNLSGQ